ncbi:MAG: ribonuclease H family protein [Lachnospiraceae bacterium]|nr:ribonuclease H family protein [Lachnospiraceae bacterium]
MKKNYYAVRSGRKPGIYKTWDECREQVTGFPGASFKGFELLSEAEEFMEGASGPGAPDSEKKKSPKDADKDELQVPKDCAVAYVDGSFDVNTGRFSYGCVMLLEGETVTFSEAFDDEELASMRNVAGEIFGSMAAMKYCMDYGIGSVTIFHDYEGIAKWCTGEWKTTKKGTADYVAFYREACERLKISFRKVKGHSGDKYNDMADRLAKEALGIA